MNEEFQMLTKKKAAKNDDSSFLRALYGVYKKIRTIFTGTHTCMLFQKIYLLVRRPPWFC